MKRFMLIRGVSSGMLYLYDRELWEFMVDSNSDTYERTFEFVLDGDDKQELVRMQTLVNKDIQVED